LKAKSENLKQAEEEADIAAEKVVKKPRIVRKPVAKKLNK